jgi:hypothetical protein
MQSDFAIAAKKSIVGGKQVTDFPFKQNWYELTVKRLIRYGADNGFDAIAIPKGSIAAKRYGQDILKATKATIQVNKYPNGLPAPTPSNIPPVRVSSSCCGSLTRLCSGAIDRFSKSEVGFDSTSAAIAVFVWHHW